MILWTASVRGSDNATAGNLHAPMKIDILKTVNLKNKRRGAVVLSFLVCIILIASASATAQLIKTQKRITALQLGDAAEGARVTIVSDSALNDYEAFRRGDRFYVRIPLADFASIPPSFRADGFEDVQVQKAGDSLLVSFRLQPGASARVDQRWNKLDVIFSAPNRTLRNNLASGSNRLIQSSRNPDTAGPMPPGTATTFSPSGTTYGSGQAFGVREGGVREGGVRESRNPRLALSPLANANRGGNNSSANPSTFGSSAIKSASPFPSPLASPSSVLSPSTASSFPPATGATPATSGTYQPTFSASPAGPVVSSGTSNWKARGQEKMDAAMKWMAANRLATLLAALILLALIVYLVLALGRRRKNQAKAKRLKAPKVQPKVLPTSESDELSYPSANSRPREFSGGRPSAPVAQPSTQSASSAAAAASDRSWVRTRPSTNSPASPGDASGEEQEREVFEL